MQAKNIKPINAFSIGWLHVAGNKAKLATQELVVKALKEELDLICWHTVIARLKIPPQVHKKILDAQKFLPIAQCEVAEEAFAGSGFIDL